MFPTSLPFKKPSSSYPGREHKPRRSLAVFCDRNVGFNFGRDSRQCIRDVRAKESKSHSIAVHEPQRISAGENDIDLSDLST